jgi:hypothetical protein
MAACPPSMATAAAARPGPTWAGTCTAISATGGTGHNGAHPASSFAAMFWDSVPEPGGCRRAGGDVHRPAFGTSVRACGGHGGAAVVPGAAGAAAGADTVCHELYGTRPWPWPRAARADARVAAVVVTGLGDLFAQQVIEGRGWDHGWTRTARVALFGLAVGVRASRVSAAPVCWRRSLTLFMCARQGPVISQWYRLMDRHIRFHNPLVRTAWLSARVPWGGAAHVTRGLGRAETVARVVADQALIAPLFTMSFLYYNDVAGGRGHAYAVDDVSEVQGHSCETYTCAEREDPYKFKHTHVHAYIRRSVRACVPFSVVLRGLTTARRL